MPIPEFTQYGLLPIGVYCCDLSEIESVFVFNDTRRTIWDGLNSFIALLKPINDINRLYLDGGFITNKLRPKDIDVVVQYPNIEVMLEIQLVHRFLGNRSKLKSTYKVDTVPCFGQEDQRPDDIREYFQILRPEDALRLRLPKGSKKGILKIALQP